MLWRAALPIQEALALTETDHADRCSVLVQHGKGGHRREVGMDMWAFTALRLWLTERAQLPVGPLFCVIDGPTRGARAWSSAAVRAEFRRLAAGAGVRRFAPPAPPCPRCRARPRRRPAPDSAPTARHRNMATTSTYLSGIGAAEVIATVASRPAPMMSATAGLEL